MNGCHPQPITMHESRFALAQRPRGRLAIPCQGMADVQLAHDMHLNDRMIECSNEREREMSSGRFGDGKLSWDRVDGD